MVRPTKWIEVKKNADLPDCARQMAAAGRVIAVQWLFLACNARETSKARRDCITEFVKVLRGLGCEIWEIASGQRTDTARSRNQMVADACRAATRLPRAGNQLGRPPRMWTGKQRQIIWTEWFSRNNATNEDAATAASKRLEIAVSSNQMWHAVRDMRRKRGRPQATGASGRPWKSGKGPV